jgi:hypothetical protein
MADFNKNFLLLKNIIFASVLSLILFSSFSQAYTVIEAEGYQIQLFIEPDPLIAQKETGLHRWIKLRLLNQRTALVSTAIRSLKE